MDARQQSEATARTILVADNEADVLALVQSGLARDGYRILTASDGQAALELARQELPDLCVLDVMMPKLTGFEVTQALRAENATRAIRVILLTARSHETDVVRGFDSGVDDYVMKPFSPQELRMRVRALLSR